MDLAETYASTPMRGALKVDAMLVAVLRDGTVHFAVDKVSASTLRDKLRARVKQGAEKKVYIKADAGTRYGAVVEVLDGVRDAGIQNVAFVADQR